MMGVATLELSWSEWFQLFTHYMTLSLLAFGGAISTAPDMHRFLVDQHGWLSDRSSTNPLPWPSLHPAPTCCLSH